MVHLKCSLAGAHNTRAVHQQPTTILCETEVTAAALAAPFRGPVTPRNLPIGFSLPYTYPRFSLLFHLHRIYHPFSLSLSPSFSGSSSVHSTGVATRGVLLDGAESERLLVFLAKPRRATTAVQPSVIIAQEPLHIASK